MNQKDMRKSHKEKPSERLLRAMEFYDVHAHFTERERLDKANRIGLIDDEGYAEAVGDLMVNCTLNVEPQA